MELEELKRRAKALRDWETRHKSTGELVLTLEQTEGLIKRVETLEGRKMAPVQGYTAGIPWEMHLRAYDAYCKKYSPQPALIEGWCRGGFDVNELDEFIPGWREELSELARLRAKVETLQAEVDGMAEQMRVWLRQQAGEAEPRARCVGVMEGRDD